jgi:lactoylglutathione lyase
MKTLHPAYRVQDLDLSLDFYDKVGFREVGRVVSGEGATRVMLNLPGDEDVVTLELVSDPGIDSIEVGNGFSHIALQVDDLDATLAGLTEKRVRFEEPGRPGGPDGPRTCFVRDPDGYRFELVEWPPGHPNAMTRADFS